MKNVMPRAAGSRSALSIVWAAVLAALAGCATPQMPGTPGEAAKVEAADALPITEFYTAPADLSHSKPGDLIRQEQAQGYTLPRGARAVRIVYHSLSATGADVPTSAVVLIPAGKAPQGGWPVIAWAHGTSGVSQQCAPSLMRDVYYGEEGLYDMLRAGFAVIASDYHGLGTPGPHQYVNKIAQAHDVIYSVPAARAAVPELGARWVADGHSQGGLASWGVAEQERAIQDPNYLGAVSVAGAARESDFFAHLDTTPGVGFYLAFMAYGLHARYPEFAPSELLSDKVMAHYDDVTTHGCWFYGYAMYAGESGGLLRDPKAVNPWVHRMFVENALGAAPVSGPLFVIGGEGDQTVPIDAIRDAVAAGCRTGLTISFKSYPGLDHDPTMIKSIPAQLAWIRDRFAGKPAPSTCPVPPHT